MITRRAFLRTVGPALLAAPLDTAAQPARSVFRIGFLGGASALMYAPLVEALRQGLRDHGYLEGRTVSMEFRWAENQYDRLPALAAELVRLEVDVIVTQGTPAAVAAQRATSTIPIVMAIVGNPVESGLVARPCPARATPRAPPSSWTSPTRGGWRSLRACSRPWPGGSLLNPDNPAMEAVWRAMAEKARALGVALRRVDVRDLEELGGAFLLARSQAEALIVVEDGMFVANASASPSWPAGVCCPASASGSTARRAACWPTGWTSRTSGASRRRSWTRCSGARSPPTWPSSGPPGSSW